jgi:hypothetical protein
MIKSKVIRVISINGAFFPQDFSRASFGAKGQARGAFVNRQANVAVVPNLKLVQDYLFLIIDAAQALCRPKIGDKLIQLKGSPALQYKLPQVLNLLRAGRVAAAAEVIHP